VVRAVKRHAPAVDAVLPAKVIVPSRGGKSTRRADRGAQEEPIGVWLAPDDDPLNGRRFRQDRADRGRFPEVQRWPRFSIGRLLRERFTGRAELRAIGDVLRDQLRFHARCGFDAFAVRGDKDIHDALNAFGELSIPYQGAVDNPEPLFRRRGAPFQERLHRCRAASQVERLDALLDSIAQRHAKRQG